MITTADGHRAVLDPSLALGSSHVLQRLVRLARGPNAGPRLPGSIVELQSALGGRSYRLLGRVEDGQIRVVSVREREISSELTQPGESELNEEVARAGLTAAISWTGPFPQPVAKKANGGGVYIMMNKSVPQKVGLTGSYVSRLASYPRTNTFYLGRVRLPNEDFESLLKAWSRVQAVLGTVEHAVARIFLRSESELPKDNRPPTVLHATGKISIANVLPLDLVAPARLPRATEKPMFAAKHRNNLKRKVAAGDPLKPAQTGNILTLPAGTKFELLP